MTFHNYKTSPISASVFIILLKCARCVDDGGIAGKKFPRGLAVIANAAHGLSNQTLQPTPALSHAAAAPAAPEAAAAPAARARSVARANFIVWVEPERAGWNSYLGPGGGNPFASNFTIYTPGAAPRPQSVLYDLGYPPAQQYMAQYLSECVASFGLDVLRMDFNIDPAASWLMKDAMQAAQARRAAGPQTGLSEAQHVEGLYAMWGSILADHPGILLDNCASGGRRIDLETAALAVPLWQSDMAGESAPVH